jgi:uncharacterized protein YciI
MRTALPLFIMTCLAVACQTNPQTATINTSTSDYDSTLATQYGADDYGMKSYVMTFLYAGPNRNQDSTKAMELQMAHLNNIGRLADAGKLVLAGPFLAEDSLKGIYIFDVATVAEAKKLTETNPAMQAGKLVMDLKTWYGSAALVGVNRAYSTLDKTNI